MGLRPIVLFKMIEILLKLPNVWDRLKQTGVIRSQEGHSLPDLSMVVVDLKREKWKKLTPSPPELGFLTLRKKSFLLPSVSRLFSLPEQAFQHP